MRKQELIHLHSLLLEVAEFCPPEGEGYDLGEYDRQETGPMSITHSKSDHEQAVKTLARELELSLKRESLGVRTRAD